MSLPDDRAMYFLYATREKHQTFRVDLTELFSVGLGSKGHCIDWHMQAILPGASRVEQTSASERVFVGGAYAGENAWRKLLNHLAGLRHDLRLWKLIRAGDYDFVQVRDKVFAGLVAALAARSRSLPFFYWMSFPYPEADRFRARDPQMHLSRAKRWFYDLRGALTDFMLYRWVLPRAAHVFVQSDQMKTDVAARGVSLERMTPVPMGINLRQLLDCKIKPAADTRLDGRKPLVYVGTLVRLRRMDFLLEMLRDVRVLVSEALLVLVGDAPAQDLAFLKTEAERLGVSDHVVFTGFLPMEQAWSYALRAAVCLSPFRPSPILDSTSPTKVIEYLALGRPVVANSHPDQSKVLGGSGAGYAVAYEPKAFADAVLDLLSHAEQAEEMGRRGPDYVRIHRDYEQMSRCLETKYLELLGWEKAVAMS